MTNLFTFNGLEGQKGTISRVCLGFDSVLSRLSLGFLSVKSQKLFTLLVCLLFVGIGQMWGADATITGIENHTSVTVNSKSGLKCATGKKSGSMKITVPSGATSISFYISGWGSDGTTVSVTPTANVNTTSVTPEVDACFTGNSTTFSTDEDESTYACTITLKSITASTDITFSSGAGKRFIIWGATYSTGGGSTPTISPSSSMTAFVYSGGSPVAQSFSVSGSNLTANVTVEAPSNYQVSLNGSDWSASGGSKTITASGTLSATTVYVRLAPGLSASSSYSGNISLSSTGATTRTVAVSGSVPYTITWSANGATHATTYVAVGGTLVLPGSDPVPNDCGCTGKAFYGWYGLGTSYSHASNAPAIAAAGDAVSADKTYYAVFADASAGTGGYEYIGDAGVLEAGETYIFVSSKSTGSAYALKSSNLPNNNTSGVKGSAVSVTIASGPKITTVNTDLEFYCDSHDEEGLDELYIGETSNTLRINGNGIGYGDARAFYDNTGLYGWNNAGSTFYDVYYNSTSTKFEASSSASGRVYAFKKSSITYTNFATTCCTALGSINGSFFWTTLFRPLRPDKSRAKALFSYLHYVKDRFCSFLSAKRGTISLFHLVLFTCSFYTY